MNDPIESFSRRDFVQSTLSGAAVLMAIPAAASAAAGAVINTAPESAPCTKSRRLNASLKSVMKNPPTF